MHLYCRGENKMAVQWKTVSEQCWSPHRVVPAPNPWWRVRREIEEAMHIHGRRQMKANLQAHYISGHLVDSDRPLQSSDDLLPGSRIVIKREPVDAALAKRHGKPQPTMAQWARLTEDERLDHVLAMTFDDMIHLADAAAAERARQDAPEDYNEALQCGTCGRKGHGPWSCPKRNVRGFIPLARRHLPHGIPHSRLRPVETEDELDRAYRTHDGQLVVVMKL